MEIRRVIYPTDYSQGAAAALPAALEMARRFEAPLIALHVSERLVDVVPVAAGVPPVELEAGAELDARARSRLGEWMSERVPEGLDYRLELMEGAPAEEIVAFADAETGTLVVMGTQGHSKLERFLMGSVTEEVLRRCHVPVLVVPARRPSVM